MADVDINKFRASVVRDGSKPSSPGFIVSEGQDPVNPPGTNNYVPYSGATANVELGEFGVEAGFVTLDTTPTNTPTEQGTIFWDADDETVDIILNGYTMKIGEDLFYPVKNQTGSTIAKGTAVRFNGTVGASGRLLIAPFIADGSVPSSRFMGVTAEEILNGEDGKVLYFGRVRGINTNAFNEGDILYASTTVAGGYQTAIPVPPNNIVQIAAVVTKSINQGTIFVRPTLGSNINTDEGVKITSAATGDLLQLQAGGLWENKTLAQVIGSAYVPSTRTLTINGTAYDLSANRSWTVGDMFLDEIQTVTARKDFNTNTLQLVVNGTSQKTVLTNSPIDSGSYSNSINAFGFNASNNLYFSKGGNNNGIFAFSNSATRTYTLKDASGTLAFTSDIPVNPVGGTGTANYLPKFTGSTTIGNSNLINDASGNLGLGVTPSAWGSVNKVFETTAGTSMFGRSDFSAWGRNFYYNSSDAGIYTGNGHATAYFQEAGKHLWATAPSGTAGNAISFTQAMTLDANGRLALGGTTVTDSTLLNIQGSSATHNVGIILNKTNATAQVYGIINQGPLDIYNYTSSTYMLRITSGGNLLVGTTTDNGARLQVSGFSRFDRGTLQFTLNPSYAGGNVYSQLQSTGALALATGGDNNRLYIDTSGNVGIGTSSPSGALHIYGSAYSSSRIYLQRTSGALGTYSLGVQSADNCFGIVDEAQGNLTRLFISNTGNVLIGTTTDNGAKLQVNGDILTSAPSGGTAGKWKLGTATSGSYTIGGKIRIEINGVAYDILTT